MVSTFFITSYGRTATYWLTSMLNLHPEVFCTHGPTLERLASFTDTPPIEHTDETVRNQDAFYALPLSEIIEKMQEKAKAAVYGNVHAFTAVRLQKKLKWTRYKCPLQRVNLLRHPFTRIQSYSNHCRAQAEQSDFMRDMFVRDMEANPGYHSLKDLVLSRFNVDFSRLENRLFIYAVIMQGNDLSDRKIRCSHICYERLVSDGEYFQWFFRFLTGNRLQATGRMLTALRTHAAKNTSASAQTTSSEVVSRWEQWKVFLVRFVLEGTPPFARLYKSLDYDIDFIFDIRLK